MLENPNNIMSIFVDADTGIKVADITDTRMYFRMVYNAMLIKSTTNSLRIDLDNISAHRFSEHNSLSSDLLFRLNQNGVAIYNGDNNHVLTSNASTIDITQYALKTELPTVPTNVSQLTNDSNFITQQDADAKYALANSLNTVNDSVSSLRVGLSKKQDKITVNGVDITDIETADITKLRTIVRDLIDALNTSGLIRTNSNLE